MSSPLNSILVGARRAHVPARSGAAACAALLLALTFLARAAAAATPAGAHEFGEGDARRVGKILSKLRLLHEAAGAGDAAAYRGLASKLYPGLFVKVAELPPGDLSTDLSTAVFLAERLGSTWPAADAAAADCAGERPDIYLPLCLELRGGTARQLLLAKSRLHARWAEAALRSSRGEADAGTAPTLSAIRAARANDQLIAAHIVETLRRLEAPSSPARAAGEESKEALRDAAAMLEWLPRSPTFYQLQSARQAFEDGLWWHDKARQAKSLVISAKSFVPDPLKDLKLDANQVISNAQANWRSAARHARLAELSLSQPSR